MLCRAPATSAKRGGKNPSPFCKTWTRLPGTISEPVTSAMEGPQDDQQEEDGEQVEGGGDEGALHLAPAHHRQPGRELGKDPLLGPPGLAGLPGLLGLVPQGDAQSVPPRRRRAGVNPETCGAARRARASDRTAPTGSPGRRRSSSQDRRTRSRYAGACTG